MGLLRLVLGDQLSPDIAALDGIDPARDVVLMAEVMGECTYVPHHKQKLVLVLSAVTALLVGLILTLATLVGPGFATLIVILATLVVAGLLGWLAYRHMLRVFGDKA